jgi:hypothetical protein
LERELSTSDSLRVNFGKLILYFSFLLKFELYSITRPSQASDSYALVPPHSRRSNSSDSSRDASGLLIPASQQQHRDSSNGFAFSPSNPSSKRSSAAYDNPVFTLSENPDGSPSAGNNNGKRSGSKWKENAITASHSMANQFGKKNEGMFQGGFVSIINNPTVIIRTKNLD